MTATVGHKHGRLVNPVALDAMIRPARLDGDMPRLLAMGRDFFHASALAQVADFDDESFIATLRGWDDMDTLLVAISGPLVVGMVGALVYPAWFNGRHLTGQELFWWVDPEFRGRGHGMALYRALEERIIAQRVNSFTMGATETLKPDSVARFYAREGYVPTERLYARRF